MWNRVSTTAFAVSGTKTCQGTTSVVPYQSVHTGHILYRADRGDGLQVFRERGHLEGKDALERERSCGEA